MSELTDLIISQTDPVSALLLAGVAFYTRKIEKDLSEELQYIRERVERVEDTYIPDGGLPPESNDD